MMQLIHRQIENKSSLQWKTIRKTTTRRIRVELILPKNSFDRTSSFAEIIFAIKIILDIVIYFSALISVVISSNIENTFTNSSSHVQSFAVNECDRRLLGFTCSA